MAHQSGSTPTLPVFETVLQSYRSVFENFIALLRISWAWLAIMVVLFVFVLRNASMLSSGPDGGGWGLTAVLGVIALLALVLGFSSIAVAWHRILLLKETSDVPFNLRMDRPVWAYLGYSLLLIVIMWVLTIPAAIVLSPLLVLAPSS